MIFHFKTGNVTFFEEDKEYFEKRLSKIRDILGWKAGDEDSLEISIAMEKGKQHSGDRFSASATLIAPHGKFYAEVGADNIKKCADLLQKKLKGQLDSF
ncbi:hypothetical protein K9M41_04005 [Candidatus Gracilibacteria bacterium]|nr:hypothetical protein [Candidatus Gracilibacteria bacterium]